MYLQYLNVTTITNLGCRMILSNYAPAQEIVLATTTTPQQTCVFGNMNSGSSICNGDKGAPLFRPLSGVLTGVLSFATCAEKVPAVFTLVGYYQAWILAQTNVTSSTFI